MKQRIKETNNFRRFELSNKQVKQQLKSKIFKHQLNMILRCLAVGRPRKNSQSMPKR